MFGGVIGLALAKGIGRRRGRFFLPNTDERRDSDERRAEEVSPFDHDVPIDNLTDKRQLNEKDFRPNDIIWMTFGCMLLWCGW